MDIQQFQKIDDYQWCIEAKGNSQVPAIIYASRQLIEEMDQKVYQQITNVTLLPGIVKAAYAMPDAHWGYGFPIGGVAAFDPNEGGVVSGGGVGFDISCGVRLLATNLTEEAILAVQKKLADTLFNEIPAGVGSKSHLKLSVNELNQVLTEGAKWAVKKGYGELSDLEFIEEEGTMRGANPDKVSAKAKERQQPEMGTLGSGNHYLEVQVVDKIHDETVANTFGLTEGQVVVSIHCGSRGLGHQIGTDYLREMVIAAPQFGIHLPDRELACAPILSDLGQAYLGAMRAAMNCAMANRQLITHFARVAFASVIKNSHLRLVYDVSHNTCKEESHEVAGKMRKLFVHRKGATRSFGPNSEEIPAKYQQVGQPVIIGGSMGTCSYVLVGMKESKDRSFGSACHGAGRAMSRTQAAKKWEGKSLIQDLAKQGIFIRSQSYRGVAEEAPLSYKNVNEVVEVAQRAGLAKKVAYLRPLICVKG